MLCKVSKIQWSFSIISNRLLIPGRVLPALIFYGRNPLNVNADRILEKKTIKNSNDYLSDLLIAKTSIDSTFAWAASIAILSSSVSIKIQRLYLYEDTLLVSNLVYVSSFCQHRRLIFFKRVTFIFYACAVIPILLSYLAIVP